VNEIKIRIHINSGKFFDVIFNTGETTYADAFLSIYRELNIESNRIVCAFETLKGKTVSIILNNIVAIEQL